MRTGLVTGVANANLAVVDGRAFFDDGADVFHRRWMINQDIEGGIGVIEIFDDQGVALFARAADKVALFGIMAIVDAVCADFVRRAIQLRQRVFFGGVDGGGEAAYFGVGEEVGDDEVSQSVKFVFFNRIHLCTLFGGAADAAICPASYF